MTYPSYNTREALQLVNQQVQLASELNLLLLVR